MERLSKVTNVQHCWYMYTVYVPGTGNPAGTVHLQQGAGRAYGRGCAYPRVPGGVYRGVLGGSQGVLGGSQGVLGGSQEAVRGARRRS